METAERVVIYNFQTNRGFLLRCILPEAIIIEAIIGESSDALCRRLPADMTHFIFHLDTSMTARMPEDRDKLLDYLRGSGVRILNGSITNITKQYLQSRLNDFGLRTAISTEGGDPGEHLFVKSNLNYGGEKESRLSDSEREYLGLPARSLIVSHSRDYKVLRRQEIPQAWWTDQSIFIEKFVANADDCFYRFYVLGSAVILTEAFNPAVIKKMEIGLRRRDYYLRLENGRLVDTYAIDPDLIYAGEVFIRSFGLDFGTFELVRSDAREFFVIDVTTTSYWGNEPRPEFLSYLRSGL